MRKRDRVELHEWEYLVQNFGSNGLMFQSVYGFLIKFSQSNDVNKKVNHCSFFRVDQNRKNGLI